MLIPIDTEKAFDKIQHLFIIKAFSKLGREGNFLSFTKGTYKNLKLTSYLMVKELMFSF